MTTRQVLVDVSQGIWKFLKEKGYNPAPGIGYGFNEACLDFQVDGEAFGISIIHFKGELPHTEPSRN